MGHQCEWVFLYEALEKSLNAAVQSDESVDPSIGGQSKSLRTGPSFPSSLFKWAFTQGLEKIVK